MARTPTVNALWVVLAVVLGAFSAWQVHTDSERAECQAQYNLAFAEQLRIRSELATTSDQAQSTLLLGVSRLVVKPPADTVEEMSARDKEFRRLFANFEEAVLAANEAREETPLPLIPDCAKI